MSERAKHFSVRLGLLDAQIVDRDRLPLGRVDDVELRIGEAGQEPQVEAILTGSQALGERIGGTLGRWMSATSARMRGDSEGGPAWFDPTLISELLPMVRLTVAFNELPQIGSLEEWLSTRFVERLPGTGNASE